MNCISHNPLSKLITDHCTQHFPLTLFVSVYLYPVCFGVCHGVLVCCQIALLSSIHVLFLVFGLSLYGFGWFMIMDYPLLDLTFFMSCDKCIKLHNVKVYIFYC